MPYCITEFIPNKFIELGICVKFLFILISYYKTLAMARELIYR